MSWSEGNKEEGRPATASPHAVPTTHGQAVARANPQGAIARRGGAYGHDGLWPAHWGDSHWQRSARKGLLPVVVTASTAGVATPLQGSCRWARTAATCVGTAIATA
ncbi:hypothetical protein B296_00051015 [Ensete ventricosum]|uniref:Uncharacterized protein n=1 Tax=Ensete ventricosum TaxID=4639 RepID=A0A426XCB5_ENSVE|nr:hypothetical protein B296_00051015 [Ensete ventricosum]